MRRPFPRPLLLIFGLIAPDALDLRAAIPNRAPGVPCAALVKRYSPMWPTCLADGATGQALTTALT